MRPKKRRQSWPLPARQRRRNDRTVTLSQIVHLTLRRMFDPDANFDKQRRPEYLRTDPPKTCALYDDPHGPEFSPAQRDRAALLLARMMVTNRVAQRSGVRR